MKPFSILLLFIILSSCKYNYSKIESKNEAHQTLNSPLTINKKALNFLAMGDFGINGKDPQREVANAMGIVADKLDASFIISTGDNFYPKGVQSVNDHRFKTSFENVYTAPSLQKDWYVVLGNHDYQGDIKAQINYSTTHKRWHMPASYFYKTFSINGDSTNQVLIIFLDTNPLSASYYTNENYQKNVQTQDSLAQKKWLENVLQSDTSHIKWRIAVGHHPLFTGGEYKDDRSINEIKASLKSVFDKYKIDAYISGHDHGLQSIKPDGNTFYFISAGGSGHYDEVSLYPKFGKFAAASTGFMTFSVTPKELVVQIINAQGIILHKDIILKESAVSMIH